MQASRKISSSRVAAVAKGLAEAGLSVSQLDVLPDGTLRWYFGTVPNDEDAELDRELREFEAKHIHR